MAVYLGDNGGIEIRRFVDGDDPIDCVLKSDYVNTDVNRFEHPFDTPLGPGKGVELSPFITGDRIRIETPAKTDNTPRDNVVLLKDNSAPTVEFYVHVDISGNLACYRFFEDAINNVRANRYELVKHTDDQELRISLVEGSTFPGRITSYEFTTDRETVDTTTIGDEFPSATPAA